MFGFLNPRPHSAAYRRCYARVCQHHRRVNGPLALPFQSYESVFLFQAALDAAAFPAGCLPNVRCCRLAPLRSAGPDVEVGRFCADFALLLAGVKLDDDVRDAGGLARRLARWSYRKPVRRARAYFAALDGRFDRNLAQLLADHDRLERGGVPVALEEYAEPTALAFGYVFGLAAALPGLAGRGDTFAALGKKVGAALIAFDCATDWPRDRARGEFNPLPDEAAAAEAFAWSADRLGEAADIARTAFGARAQSAATLTAVRDRVLRPCRPKSVTVGGMALAAVGALRRPAVMASGAGGGDAGAGDGAFAPDPVLDAVTGQDEESKLRGSACGGCDPGCVECCRCLPADCSGCELGGVGDCLGGCGDCAGGCSC